MAAYEFVTIWRIKAPIEAVWNELSHSERWPSWGRAVLAVPEVQAADQSGLGGIHKRIWRSALPFSMTFEMPIVRVEAPHLLEGGRGQSAERQQPLVMSTSTPTLED